MNDSPATPDPVPPGARHAPHTLRNREPILAVLRAELATARCVLEIGCGTGEQAPFFAAALDHLHWLPSDVDEQALESARAWVNAAGNPGLHPPLRIDAAAPDWPLPAGMHPDAIVSLNMIHIAPWSACAGLLAGGGRLLPAGGPLLLYGPFRVRGAHSALSNARFDETLKARNPDWGIRDLETVAAEAARANLDLVRTVPMPANNLMAIFRRRQAAGWRPPAST